MLDLIADNVPRAFILNHMEGVNAAFLGAKRLTDDIVRPEEPERVYMLGQHRHWGLEQGFRNAATQSGLETFAPHTTPRGGRYSLVRSGKLLLARTRIVTIGGSLRPSKFLRDLAPLNRFMEPYQWDMFRKEHELPKDTIFGLMLTVAHKRGQNEAQPAFMGLGIPHSDLGGWHFRDSLENILSGYACSDVEVIPDRVTPRLKVQRDRSTDSGDASA